MPLTNFHSVAIGIDPNGYYGAVQSPTTTNLPDPTALTFEGLGCVRAFADLFDGFDEPANDADMTRLGAGRYMLEPETIYNQTGGAQFGAADGEAIQRLMTDGINLRVRLNTLGGASAFSSYDAIPWVKMLASVCGTISPSSATDTITGVTANTFTPSAPADYTLGQLVCLWINNVAEYAVVTDIDAVTPLITVSPAFSATPGAAVTLRHCYTFYPVLDESNAGYDFQLRLDGDEVRRYAWGCRLSSFGFEFDGETGFLLATAKPAVVLTDDSAAATISWTVPDGNPVQLKQSRHVVSGATVASGSVPGSLSHATTSAKSWKFTINTALSFTPQQSTILGATGCEIGDSEALLEIDNEPDSVLSQMLRKREERQVVMGTGPAAVGMGSAFALMAAHPTRSAMNRGEGDESRQSQSVELRNGVWALDDGSGGAANTPWRWGFPL